MKLAIILLGVMTTAVTNVSTMTQGQSDELDMKWLLFTHEYMKNYETDEEFNYRKSVFIENLKLIDKHNEMYRKGQKSYELTCNVFSDLTQTEFVRQINGIIKSVNHGKLAAFANISIPDSIDYRTKGYVTPIKDQGPCSSAWAFSAVGALEGQIYRLTKNLTPLSAQNLIDCSSTYENHGCEGGTTLGAFHYISNVGINSAIDYLYEGQDRMCRFDHNNSVVNLKFSLMTMDQNETLLKSAVGLLGPVSATIDISQDDFRLYRAGVYYNANCSSTNVNHAVLIVGYGTDLKGQDYWIVKNSWGEDWGQNGYVYMARNRNNNCGIATLASVPMM